MRCYTRQPGTRRKRTIEKQKRSKELLSKMTEIQKLERLAAIRKHFKRKWIERVEKRKRNLLTSPKRKA